MLMTEEQARSKWCPHARASDQNDPPLSINRVRTNRPDADCLCIASGCMAWRTLSAADRVLSSGILEDVGYCGAFGKPEAA